MKATDLMIGDWVQAFPDQCRVDGIICLREEHTAEEKWMAIVHLGGNKYERVNVDILEPIPLTEEILENNNFQSKEDPYSHRKFFFLGKNEYNLDVYFDNGTIILVEADYEPTVYAYMCDCKYVHELQHLLKGLEIEKEIII
jgi:hypothetical protein